MRWRTLLAWLLPWTLAYAMACSGSSSTGATASAGQDGSVEPDGGSPSDAAPPDTQVGATDGAPTTKLQPLPTLSNVVATQNDDSASIAFDPFAGALDYRVYPLPSDDDVTVGANGQVTIKNATYRCAGNRESPSPNVEDAGSTGSWVTTEVSDTVGGLAGSLAEA